MNDWKIESKLSSENQKGNKLLIGCIHYVFTVNKRVKFVSADRFYNVDPKIVFLNVIIISLMMFISFQRRSYYFKPPVFSQYCIFFAIVQISLTA
jgi:hypothetical protein